MRGSFGGLADATGMAVDGDGAVYVLDSRTPALHRFDPCAGWEQMPCILAQGWAPGEVRDPHGLALTPWGDLLVADTGNARVQVIALQGWRVRHLLGAPDDAGWEPWDVAVDPRGRILVSDRAGGRIVRFDRVGRPLGSFGGEGDAPLRRPTHLAVDQAGRIYVVEEGEEAVRVLGPDGRPLEVLHRHHEALGRFCRVTVTVDGQGNVLLLGDHVVDLGPPGSSHCPSTRALDTTIRLEPAGAFTSTALDSSIYRCRWHRVVVRADLPAGTALTVRTFTAEAPRSDAEVADLPDDRWSEPVRHDGTTAGEWDCLVRSADGRFLWLRVDLEGTGTATPSVHVLTVSYPRQTSTAYLPAVYRHQVGGDDFVERFLAIFDRTFSDLSAEVDDLARFADPAATPAGEGDDADLLTWLASWVGLSLDRHWPVPRRRQLVAEASWLFAHRGTVAGLRRHLEIYLGYAPRILEHHRLRRWLHVDHARLGECSTLWGAAIVSRLQLDVHAELDAVQLVDTHDPLRDPFWVHAHTFTVFVPGSETDATRRHALERILALAKPAHTRAVLQVVEPRMRVGQALLGLDTVVGAYPRRTVEGISRLGYDAVLGPDPDPPRPPTLQVGARRIGADTLID
jgi:phage tail-like protein